MIKVCDYCKTEFEAQRSTAKYCSPKCRKDAFNARHDSVQNAKNAKNLSQNDDLRADIAELKSLLMELIAKMDEDTRPFTPVFQEDTGSLKPIADSDKPLPGPSGYDDIDDLLEVKSVTDTGGQSGMNFLNSLMALQSTKTIGQARAS